jgi:hypothetical protein
LLRERAVDRACDAFLAVVNGDYHRDQWRCHFPPQNLAPR